MVRSVSNTSKTGITSKTGKTPLRSSSYAGQASKSGKKEVSSRTKLTREDVIHVAKLAKLELSEEEIEKFTSQLSSVLDHISELNKVDTSGVEPTSQTTGLANVTRPDLASTENCLTQDEALSGTDRTYNGYFKVKAILTGRTDK